MVDWRDLAVGHQPKFRLNGFQGKSEILGKIVQFRIFERMVDIRKLL
jgi:hypothetical protein